MPEDELYLEEDETNKVEKRIKDLSTKVKDASAERDEANRKAEEFERKTTLLQKENEFLSSFSDSTSKYPGANEFKDAIKEKVMSGYSVEDATISVLAKEGKFNPAQVPQERDVYAGGSASNQIQQPGSKTLSEMTKEEKRAELMDAISRGDVSLS